MKNTKNLVLACMFACCLTNSVQAQSSDNQKNPRIAFVWTALPGKFAYMIALPISYDQNYDKVPGKSIMVLTASKSLLRDHMYASLSILGPHSYHYTNDTLSMNVSTLSADLGFGFNIGMQNSGLFGGASVGVFGGIGTTNNANSAPYRLGIANQINANICVFRDGSGGKNLVGVFLRTSYSRLAFKLDGVQTAAMNIEMEFGIKITVLNQFGYRR